MSGILPGIETAAVGRDPTVDEGIRYHGEGRQFADWKSVASLLIPAASRFPAGSGGPLEKREARGRDILLPDVIRKAFDGFQYVLSRFCHIERFLTKIIFSVYTGCAPSFLFAYGFAFEQFEERGESFLHKGIRV